MYSFWFSGRCHRKQKRNKLLNHLEVDRRMQHKRTFHQTPRSFFFREIRIRCCISCLIFHLIEIFCSNELCLCWIGGRGRRLSSFTWVLFGLKRRFGVSDPVQVNELRSKNHADDEYFFYITHLSCMYSMVWSGAQACAHGGEGDSDGGLSTIENYLCSKKCSAHKRAREILRRAPAHTHAHTIQSHWN